MITLEQAQQLAAEGAQTLLREHGQMKIEQMTLLEFLMAAEVMAGRAISNDASGFVWRDTGERQRLFLRLAGLMLMALQQHGQALYTTHQLRRSLHPQHAEQKSLLMEDQFLCAEAKDAYVACHDAAKVSPFFDEEPWRKLKAILQRLGAEL
jgi:hypothetical protein